MPIYWGDYLADTGHLNAEQHGAYLLLIAHYWQTGKPLPDDKQLLMQICKVFSAENFEKIWSVLRNFFRFSEADGGVWRHKRIDDELKKRKKISAVRKEAVAARERKKTASNDVSNDISNDVSKHPSYDGISQSQSHTPNGVVARAPATPPQPPEPSQPTGLTTRVCTVDPLTFRKRLRMEYDSLMPPDVQAWTFQQTGGDTPEAREFCAESWKKFRRWHAERRNSYTTETWMVQWQRWLTRDLAEERKAVARHNNALPAAAE